MTLSRLLILITRNYPYEKGEPFIENEISLLNQHFDDVLIISSLTSKKPVHTRIVPKNISIEYNSKQPYINTLLRNVVRTSFWKNFYIEVKEEPKVVFNFKRIAKCAAFASIPDEAVNNIWVKIKGYNFEKYNEIILYSYWFHYTAAIAIKLKKLINNPNILVVSRTHRYDLYEYADQNNYIPFRKYLFRNVDKVFSISEDGHRYLLEKYPEFRDKISISRLGVLERGINPTTSNGVFNLVSCSRVEDLKRVHLIIEILSNFKVENIKWTHFGNGSMFNETLKRAEKLTKNIIFDFKGSISNSELMDYYRKNRVDLFINVSSNEGIPVSIMEAISFGIPIIATNVGGTSEIVKHDINGYLIEKDFQIDTVVNLIREMMRMQREKINHMRENSRKIYEEKFNSTKNYKEFVEIILNKNLI